MKWLFFLLLLANIGFAVVIQWGPGPRGDSQLLQQQINPERIKLLSLGTPKAGGEKPAASPAAVVAACLEWGSFAGNDLARAESSLDPLRLEDRLTRRILEETRAYWVYIPPLKTRQDAEKKIDELKALGVSDYFLVQDSSKWRNAVSLGIFKTEEAAKKFLAGLQEKGIKSAVAGQRSHLVKQVVFVVREPGEAVAARLVELKQEFPGSELKATDCSERPVSPAFQSAAGGAR